MGKNEAAKGILLEQLATELETSTEDLIPIVKRLGISDPSIGTVIPEAIATNIKVAKSHRDKVVKPQLKEGAEETPEINRKLSRKEVKEIANDLSMTQIVVRELDRALHNRECQIEALRGFQEQERKQQKQDAYETGAIVAQLQELKRRGKELDYEENALVDEGLSTENTPTAIASSMGVDLQGLLNDLESDTTKQTVAFLERNEGIQQLLEGTEPEGGEPSNPFVKLAYQRFRNQSD